MIGLERGEVKLAPYNAVWKRLFEAEKGRLVKVVGEYILDIQHVGSTSIPGMVAKPIIDIAVAVEDFEAAKVSIKPIESLGYVYRGELGIPRRHYFVFGEPRRFHLHMNEFKSDVWLGQILFRDTLIEHQELAEAYAALKVKLAGQFPSDREAYLLGKAPFIEGVLKKTWENKDRTN